MDSSHASFLWAVALREPHSFPVGTTRHCRGTGARATCHLVGGSTMAMGIAGWSYSRAGVRNVLASHSYGWLHRRGIGYYVRSYSL